MQEVQSSEETEVQVRQGVVQVIQVVPLSEVECLHWQVGGGILRSGSNPQELH